jgi:catechol 2,3-dioxygenase-like lactoylglutathione lyase family enzyme
VAFVCRYLAFFVDDLQAAETFYGCVFGMRLLFRESKQDDGLWHTLRQELDWDVAAARGIEADMVALQRDDFVLALFQGSPRPGTVKEICFAMPAEAVDEVRANLTDDVPVRSLQSSLTFADPFGFTWTLRETGTPFRSSGEIAGRWLD